MLNGFLLERKLKQYKQLKREQKEEAASRPKRLHERAQQADRYRARVEQFLTAVPIPFHVESIMH